MNINPISAPMNFTGTVTTGKNLVKNASKVAAKGAEDAGILDRFVYEPLAKAIGKISSSKYTEKIVDTIGKWKSPYQRLCDIGSIVLTVFTVKDTLKSKKISDERKPFMVVNNILVTAVSSTLAAVIDRLTYTPQKMIAMAHAQNKKNAITAEKLEKFVADNDNMKIVKNMKEYFKKADKTLKGEVLEQKAKEYAYIFKNTEKFSTGLGKFKSTFIFTAIVRFLVPVAFIPITAKIIDKLEAKAKSKKSKAGAENTPQATGQNNAAQNPAANVTASNATQNPAANVTVPNAVQNQNAQSTLNNNSSIIKPIDNK